MENQKLSILKSGILELRAKNITNFSEVQVPNIVNYLDFSNNKIVDFDSFAPHSGLNTLILDGNPILSFNGFPAQHNISVFSCFDSPISKHPQFRILALFALGKTAKTINGENVTNDELLLLSDEKLKTLIKNEKNNEKVFERFSCSIRNGYIGELFPQSISAANDEACKYKAYPVSMKIVKLAKISKMSENEKEKLFEQVFSNKVFIKSKRPPKSVNDKLTKQKQMIEYLMEEIEQLKKEKENKEKEIENEKKENKISEETEEMYLQMLDEHAFLLNENDAKLEQINEEKEQLRELAKKAIGQPEADLSDTELASLLAKKFNV